jgi:carboxyl-terminal processing protease
MRRLVSSTLLIVLLPVLFAAGLWLGGHPGTLPSPVRNVFVSDSDGRVYEEAVDVIERDYYRKVDRNRLLNTSLDAAVRSLDDRFSAYLSPRAYTHFQQATSGEFEGVGMSVEPVRRGLRILKVFERSPASRAGLRPGDLVIAVDGKEIRGMGSGEATALIKGKAGTTVRLRIVSGGRTREKTLRRERVEVPVVTSTTERANGERIAHIRLVSFTAGAHAELRDAVKRALAGQAKGIALDLRGNGGGLLNEAVQVASIFVPDGEIVSTRGRSRPERTYEATGDAIPARIPVVVLVDRGSASASEIVAGALQDHDRAEIVGTRTFGKGVFQEIERLSNGAALELVAGEYFTPDGRNVGGGGPKEGKGLTPDVKAADDPGTRPDEALDVAVGTVAREARGR